MKSEEREETRRERKKISSSPSELIFFFWFYFLLDLVCLPVYVRGLLESFSQAPFFFLFHFIFVIMCLFCYSKTCQSLMSASCCLKSLYWPVFAVLYNFSLITMAVSSEVSIIGKHHYNMVKLILLQHGLKISHTGTWRVCRYSSFSVPLHTLADMNSSFQKTYNKPPLFFMR